MTHNFTRMCAIDVPNLELWDPALINLASHPTNTHNKGTSWNIEATCELNRQKMAAVCKQAALISLLSVMVDPLNRDWTKSR